MKKIFALLFSITFAFSLLANDTLVFRETIYFESGKAELDNDELLKLNAFVKKLYFHGQIAIEIEGHTDNVGSLEKNLKLSEERAKNVENYLKIQGFDFRVEAEKAMGQNAPKASNSSKEGQKLNRRVEVKAIVNKLKNVQDFFESVRTRQTQTFTVNCQEPQTVVGKNGIKLDIPANAFVNANGEPVVAGKVEIRLVEATKMSDMLLLGLTTMTSDGNALETGGMFRVEAFQNNQPLSLAPDKNIGFTIKTNKPLPNMNTYVASNTSSKSTKNQVSPATIGAQTSTPNANDAIRNLNLNQGVVKWNSEPVGAIKNKASKYITLDSTQKSKLKKMYAGPEPKNEINCSCLDNIKFITFPKRPKNRPQTNSSKLSPQSINNIFVSSKKKKEIQKENYKIKYNIYKDSLEKYKRDTAEYYRTSTQLNAIEIVKLKKCVKEIEDEILENHFRATDYYLNTIQPGLVDSVNRFIDNLVSEDSVSIIESYPIETNAFSLPNSYKNSIRGINMRFNTLMKPNYYTLLEIAYNPDNIYLINRKVQPKKARQKKQAGELPLYQTKLIIPSFKDAKSYIKYRTSIKTDTNYIHGILFKKLKRKYFRKCTDARINDDKLVGKISYSNRGMVSSQNERLNPMNNDYKDSLLTGLVDYIGTINTLSWINIDRSIFKNETLDNLYVFESNEASIVLIFNNFKALLSLDRYGQSIYSVESVPVKKTNATVTSFKIINGRPFMSKLSIKSFNKEPLSLPKYVECDLEEIKAAFD